MKRPWSRGILLTICLGALAVSGGCGPAGAFQLPQDPMVGKPAPIFSFHSVHKRTFPSTNFQGKTLVLIFIRPGQPELPDLLRELEVIHQHPAFTSVQFMVMSPEDDPLTEPYWVGLHSSLPVALDFTDVAGRFGAGPVPMVAVVDYRGRIRMRLDGYMGAQFHPRLEATRKLIHEVEDERTRPAASP